MLEVKDLHVRYGKVPVLRGVSLQVQRGEIVAVVGANGAGKTTLLRSISGILRSAGGRILFEGKDVTSFSGAHRVARLGIAHVLEGRRIFPHMTVLENLEIGAYLRKDARAVREDLDRMFQLFPRLNERSRQQAGTLSGGEQQMLALARSLMSKPKLLLMDEPSMGLAPVIVDQLFEVIGRIGKEGATILLIEQNAQMALRLADRAYVMELGKMVITDTGESLLGNEIVLKSYLGME